MVLGNVGTREDVEALERALADEEPLVGEHAVWTLGRLECSAAVPLRADLREAPNARVREEIESALGAHGD